jgi:hypothetical protein
LHFRFVFADRSLPEILADSSLDHHRHTHTHTHTPQHSGRPYGIYVRCIRRTHLVRCLTDIPMSQDTFYSHLCVLKGTHLATVLTDTYLDAFLPETRSDAFCTCTRSNAIFCHFLCISMHFLFLTYSLDAPNETHFLRCISERHISF